MQSPTIFGNRLNKLLGAWDDLAKDKSFAGMTLTEFQGKVQPSLDSRQEIKDLEEQIADATNRRDDADRQTLPLMQLVVNAIKGDPTLGDDSSLYEAAGYVRRSERKSGLSRKAKTAEAPMKPA